MNRKKTKNQGTALFIALLLSFIGLVAIAGLVAIWQRYASALLPVKTYATVREAAGGGINLLVRFVDLGCFNFIERERLNEDRIPCPGNSSTISNVDCYDVNLRFKILGEGEGKTYSNLVRICFLGYRPSEGQVAGVAYEDPLAKLGKGQIYGFYSVAYGPHNVTAYVEALYMR